jgi:hypothetical protein
MTCKQCGKTEYTHGTNFCSRKCRKAWIEDHKVKGTKKRYANRVHGGAAFDMYGNDPDGY